MSDDDLSLRPYAASDAAALFGALRDERAWEHVPRSIPRDADGLDLMIRAKLTDGLRTTFVIRLGQRVVGMSSVLVDPADPEGARSAAPSWTRQPGEPARRHPPAQPSLPHRPSR